MSVETEADSGVKMCVSGQFQRTNERVLKNIGAENNCQQNNMPLFIHDLAALPLDNTMCRYVIQQRRETSLSWKLIKKTREEEKNK